MPLAGLTSARRDAVATGSSARPFDVAVWHPTGRPRPVRAFDAWLASRVHRLTADVGVGLALWDDRLLPAQGAAVGDLVVHDRKTLLGLALNPEMAFGEAYMSGRLDVRGPFEDVIEALSRVSAPAPSWRSRLLAALTPRATFDAARENVHRHYDLGNAFYAAWLDRAMLYTCAYFERPDVDLDTAQLAKIDRVCRKLHLGAADHVADLGCGWGGFAIEAARRYGCRVTGFNVSREQLEYARARAVREGLADRVSFVDDDYRNVGGRYDAIVSLGMLEHVGPQNFPALAEVVRRSLSPTQGRGLLHFIGRDTPRPLNAWIRRRIFPGAYPPTLAEVTERVLVPAGCSVVDVENLRLHYARTLALWRSRFDAAADAVRQEYGDVFRRAWSLYLAGSEAAFATGWLQLFQVVFTPRAGDPPWWTRDDALRADPPR